MAAIIILIKEEIGMITYHFLVEILDEYQERQSLTISIMTLNTQVILKS